MSGVELFRREVPLPSFHAAALLLVDLSDAAESMGHHPSVSVNPRRVCEEAAGDCTVVIEFTTFSAGAISEADEQATHAVEDLLNARWTQDGY